MDPRPHWEDVWRTKRPHEVSWFRPHLDASLALIEALAPDRDASVIDVGGGASTLVDDVLARGYRYFTVLDLSAAALDVAKARLGERAREVEWLCGDATTAPLPERRFDLWHDRAAFHFLTRAGDRAAYIRQMARSLKRGGHAIIATFAAEGPAQCSGLDVVRYAPEALAAELGPTFRLERQLSESHRTPAGRIQPFTYCAFRVASA